MSQGARTKNGRTVNKSDRTGSRHGQNVRSEHNQLSRIRRVRGRHQFCLRGCLIHYLRQHRRSARQVVRIPAVHGRYLARSHRQLERAELRTPRTHSSRTQRSGPGFESKCSGRGGRRYQSGKRHALPKHGGIDGTGQACGSCRLIHNLSNERRGTLAVGGVAAVNRCQRMRPRGEGGNAD